MSKENKANDNVVAIAQKLRDIQRLVEEALGQIGHKPSASSRITRAATAAKSSPLALPDHILKLKDNGYLKQAKTANEVQQKLQPVYPCDLDRVAMALLRLQRRKELRKTSKLVTGKKQIAYVE
jgi:hypothetical protein